MRIMLFTHARCSSREVSSLFRKPVIDFFSYYDDFGGSWWCTGLRQPAKSIGDCQA